MTWRITLMPSDNWSNGVIELRSGDSRTWDWPNGVQPLEVFSDTVGLDVSAVPLVSGRLTPVIKVRYTAGKKTHTRLVTGYTSIDVAPVETRIEADIVVGQGTAREKEPLPMELWIHNRSPFTLTQVRVRGIGADLTWDASAKLNDIYPGVTFQQTMTPTIEGPNPRPRLSIEYGWTDGRGVSRTQILFASGEPVKIAEKKSNKIPNEVWGIVAGVLVGALASIIPRWIEERRSQKRQEKLNRQHVRGLLRLMTLQSEHAADNGVDINLKSLETVFEQEGLFAALEKQRLADGARSLWKAAERHNSGLKQAGGAQRSEDLRRAARRLSEQLEDES